MALILITDWRRLFAPRLHELEFFKRGHAEEQECLFYVALARARDRLFLYPLVNQWTEHKLGTLEIDRYGLDPKRLWPITAADAIGSNIDLVVYDPQSHEEVLVDLTTVPPNTRLQIVKAHAKAKGRRARLIIR